MNLRKQISKLIFIILFSFIFVSCSIATGYLEIDLYIKDHKFDPEVILVPDGVKIRLIVHNLDSTIEEFESIDLKREKIIPANSKAIIILAPLKIGEYKFFGEFHEDTAQGRIIVSDNKKIKE